MGGAERAGDGRHHLLSGGRYNHDVAAAQLVTGDQIRGLCEHQRSDDVVQGLVDNRLHLLHLPSGAHVRQMHANAVHLIVVRAGQSEDELGIAGLEHRPAVQQSLGKKGFAECKRARFGDDCLIKIEEGGGAGVRRSVCRCLRWRFLRAGRVGDGHRLSIGGR